MSSSADAPVAVRLRDVHKRFGSVHALRGAELSLRSGEVHAVLGENGAGKTTLLRILAGLTPPERGEVIVGGSAVRLRTPRDAWSAGIGLVHQHFTLVPTFTVLENVALGVRWSGSGLGLPLREVRRRMEALAAETGLSVPADAPVGTLGVGERQRVEILKVLLREPRVLALDEPTAVLTPGEVDTLLRLLRTQAAAGRCVVLVAHKLDEVLAVADRVTVLRGGRTVLEASRSEVSASVLTTAMVGETGDSVPGFQDERRSVGATIARTDAEPVARLEAVTLSGPRGERALNEVTLVVRRGEIVGIAGVEGNGQKELAQVLSGRARPQSGRATIPPDAGFIPQDRAREGLVPDFDVAENFALALHRQGEWRGGPLLRWPAVRATARELIARYRIAAPSTFTQARVLSGGNQQRVVVARELESGHDLLVAENPTRGLDVAATAFLHEELRRLRARGDTGIALLSTDLDEVLALADRVLVMVRGGLVAVPEGARSRLGVGALMLSADASEARDPSV